MSPSLAADRVAPRPLPMTEICVTRASGGTLAEIGLALTLGRRIVGEPGWEVEGTLRAAIPEQAVELALG